MPLTSKSIVVIPARGGSKRLPRKNIMDLGGKPLICHTIEAALESGCFSSVLVSTDDDEITQVAEAYSEVLIDRREASLSGDNVKVVDVIYEICGRPDIQAKYDVIGMMLPTAPFRRNKYLREGIGKLDGTTDSIVSFTEFEFSPYMAVNLKGTEMLMQPVFEPSPLTTGNTRTQDQAILYRPNGSFYLSWISSFLKNKSFYKGCVKGVAMPRLASIDIDEKSDILMARQLIRTGLAESDFHGT